jgi:hypothetical protein
MRSSKPRLPESVRRQRLLALFAAGWLTLNFPLLGVWDAPVRIAGLPLLPLAVFGGWAVLIAVAAWLAEGTGGGNSAASDDDDA